MRIDDDDLRYQIILSQGKGFLSENGKLLIVQLCEKTMEMLYKTFYNKWDREDAHGQGIYKSLSSWDKCDLRYGRKANPYFIEVYKRGVNWSRGMNKKETQYNISLDTIFNDKND